MNEENEDQGSELEQQQAMLQQQLQEMEQQQNADQQEKQRIEEKLTKNKLKFICSNLAIGSRTTLKETEKKTIKKAKQFPNLKKDIKQVNTLLAANRVKVATKTMSMSPAMFYVVIGALIILLVIAVVAFVGSIMPYLFPDDEGNGNGGTTSSAFGITGQDFYGGRMVYKDDEKSRLAIIEDYVALVELGITEAKTISTISSGGSEISVTIEVNIQLPNEEYDYSTFDEATFQAEYSVLYSTIFDIAKVVYKIDNGTDYANTTLLECVDGILYFGYGQTAMIDINKIINDAIIANSTVTATDGTTINKTTEVDPLISSKIEELCLNEKYHLRAEKLFVKDYVLSGEDKMKDISKENYVAFIFMPNKNVTFTKFSFSVGNADLTELTMKLTNNGNEINLKKDDFDFSNDEDSSKQAFIYLTNENLSVSAGVFNDIDVNNLGALSEGMSLFELIKNVDDYSIYLETKTNETSGEYLTIKKNGVVLELNNKEEFSFSEFETTWQSAP